MRLAGMLGIVPTTPSAVSCGADWVLAVSHASSSVCRTRRRWRPIIASQPMPMTTPVRSRSVPIPCSACAAARTVVCWARLP